MAELSTVSAAQPEQAEALPPAQHKHYKRTAGNRVFDLLVYPTIAFGVVFAFSAWMLHTTKFGTGALKQRYDGWVKGATEWMGRQSWFKSLSPQDLAVKAKHYVDVLISFAAGTLLISPIKLMEDHRQTLSRKLDIIMGTTPPDQHAYAEEPKQTWGSVLGGRALTFGIVLGVSTVGGKYIDGALEKLAKGFENTWKSFNQNASAKALQRAREWSFVSAFEGFYTAVCAVLLYVISRTLARSINKPADALVIPATPAAPAIIQLREPAPEIASLKATRQTPDATIHQAQHQQTLTSTSPERQAHS